MSSLIESNDTPSLPLRGTAVARGTLANAALPGAAFDPDEYDVELTQTSLAEADELLKSILDECLHSVGGNRAFLAVVDTLSGELVLRFTAGEGWTDDIRRLRVNVKDAPLDKVPASQAAAQVRGTRHGITRYVLLNARRYWSPDVNNDPHYIPFFEDVRSEVAVPIIARGGGAIGVINVESTEYNAFDEASADRLMVLARNAAIIIAMAEHQLREEALIAIGKDFNSTADLDTLVQDVVQQATKILRADDCSLFLHDSQSDSLQLIASRGATGEITEEASVRYGAGEGLTGWVATHREVIRVGDPRTDPRWKGLFEEAPAAEVAAIMAVPVCCQRSGTGVLRVVRQRKGSLYFLPQKFTQVDEDVLVTLAGQLAVAIDRTTLQERLINTERMAAWGEMSARSAHMIGNTVFGIKGHLNELVFQLKAISAVEHKCPAGELTAPALVQASQLAEDITRGIYRLEEILGEFRDFVMATQLHPVACDANNLLRQVTAEIFPRSCQVDLVLDLAPALPSLQADEVKLKRAFGELIENAVDFQPCGGQLTIRTTLAEAEMVRSHLRRAEPVPYVQVEFKDRGPGLGGADRDEIFRPFFSRKAKGMGLGLSIVKGIVEAHRGHISEISEEDGAHFLILLPTSQGREEASSPVPPREGG